jgi:protein TonB
MGGRQEQERFFGVLAISLSVHVFVFIGLGFAPSATEALQAHAIEFEVVQPRLSEPEKVVPKVQEPAAEPPREKPLSQPKPRPIEAAPKETPVPDKPPSAQEQTPVEFPGVTLTNEGGDATWATVVGNGSAIKGPVVAPRKTPPQRPSTGLVGNGSSGGGANIPTVNLSRPPRPPQNADALLAKYYPERAKSQGIEGQAILKVRVKSDGLVADMSVIRESFPEFGKACMEHLKNTRWVPALDRLGRSVAFDITYTCRFEVGY